MDIHTLHMEHAVLLGLHTLLTLVNFWLHRGIKGIHWFPVYNLLAFVSAVFIALRGHIPDPVSIVLGDVLVSVGYVFLHRCLTEFFGSKTSQWKLQFGFVLLTLIALLQYGAMHPNTKGRLIAYSFLLTGQQLFIAYFVFRNAAGILRVSGGLLGLVLTLLGLSNFIRGIGVILQGAPSNYLHGGSLLAWTLLNNSVLQGGVTVAFVWMTAAVLRHDLQVQASTDPLTGLLNRRAVETAAEREIAASIQSGERLSAILIDLDAFKQINDSFGHHCGDATLIAVAGCLQQGMRKNDLLARIGGDEFVALLPHTSVDEAFEIAERLRASLEELEILYGQIQIDVNASFGIAQVQNTTHDWDQLIMSCDKALYSVKSVGGNLVATQ